MPVDLNSIADRVISLRGKAGLSQYELARISGLTQAQVSAYELKKAYPNLESAIKLSAALGITVATLIGETEVRSAAPRPPTRQEMAIWILEAMAFTRPQIDRARIVLGGTP